MFKVFPPETTVRTNFADEFAEIIPLGAGCEVGRSCIILRFRGKTVMFDCGLHPGKPGNEALPDLHSEWFQPDITEVNVMLISHFHYDHCAAVPYVVCMTSFQGRILMTYPTKAIYYHVLKDHINIARRSEMGALYSVEDLEKSMRSIEVIEYHKIIYIDGIQISAFMAGHVLGAAMFLVEIDGLCVFYTGDYSREPDRHMPRAEIPYGPLHIVIIESTYGTSNHLPRIDREAKFLRMVLECLLMKKGKVLLPMVALWRAQELLLLLEHFWGKNQRLQHIPIFQISSIAVKTMPIYQTFIEMMNDNIKKKFQLHNPFQFKHILVKDRITQIDNTSWPCIVLTSPSTMTTGKSRDLFENWCEDNRNSLIITDFAVQGTLSREVLNNPKIIRLEMVDR